MSPSEREWDKELADIDKVIARAPASPGPGALPVGKAAALPAPARTRKVALTTWLQVLLGGLLAIGMTQWPYAHGCGIRLILYLGATGVVVVAGLWGAITSWHRRMGLAHILALLVTGWGLVLVAREVLPRVGYAKQVMNWMCP